MGSLRILELILDKFSPILAGMGKEKIVLDLRKSSSRINVFIGKIGSGKTYILSHLQPFPTVGTLDVRNSEDPILIGEDGYKRIIYLKNESIEYVIEHFYTWNKTGHSKKSYIQKNGIELNENGNLSSFLEIVEMELGIDPSFLRLIRIGNNVSNFINMKATERKDFIASKLKDTEFFLFLYKHWSNELRTMNTKISILMNKLATYGDDPKELEKKMESLEDEKKELQMEIDKLKQKRFELKANTNAILKGKTQREFMLEIETLSQTYDDKKKEFDELEGILKGFSKYPEITEVSKEIGKLDSKLSACDENLHNLSVKYEECATDLNNALDRKVMMGNRDHMQNLKETYANLNDQMNEYEKQLKHFKCEHSSVYLESILEEINTMNVLIQEITQYDTELVKRIFGSTSNILHYAEERINILNMRKLKVQRLINNLRFTENYESPSNLFFPPFCPTKSCPYYTTHPDTLKGRTKNKDAIEEQFIKYQNEIKELDIEIFSLGEYPLIYGKISSLRSYWGRVSSVLRSIGALRTESLLVILTVFSQQVWYSYDKIIDTIDLLKKRDKYYELVEQIKKIRNEMSKMDLAQDEMLDKKIDDLRRKKDSLEKEIEEEEITRRKTEESLKSFNEIYVELSKKNEYENRLRDLTHTLEELDSTLIKMEKECDIIQASICAITDKDRVIVSKEAEMKEKMSKLDVVRAQINDIKYVSKELGTLSKEQKWMSYMTDAVSSKKGIPMEMVKLFFKSCRSSINEMLYMVMEDDFEILDFKIKDKEFTIPYIVNGNKSRDIVHASQGQTSLVSTALSFALTKELSKKSGIGEEYTIPLLDEPDAALHKVNKPKLISIIMKYLDDIGSQQCFVISHDENTFDGYPVQIIMTTEEFVNQNRYANAIHL